MKGKKLESSSTHTRVLRLLRLRSHSRPRQPPKQTPIIISSDSDENKGGEEIMEQSHSPKREVNIRKKIKEEYLSEEDQEETEEEEEETEDEEEEEETEEEEEETENEKEETEDDEENRENEEDKEESEDNEEENDENQSEEGTNYECEMSWDRKAMINESGAGENGESVEFFCVQSSAGSVKLDSSYSNHNQNDGGNSNANINDNFSCVKDNADSSASNPVEKELDENDEWDSNITLKAGTKRKKSGAEKMEVDHELPSKDKVTTKTQRGNEEVGTSKSLKIRKAKKDKMSQSEFLNLLSNINWNHDDKDTDELDNKSPSLTTDSHENTVLPHIFSFGDDDVKAVEKTKQELELEELWLDFDLALNALKIGVFNDDQEQSDEPNEQTCDFNEASVCEKGMHKYIIDDQIGIKCMFCTYVQMDIRYVLPSWDFHTGAGFGRREKLIEENPLLHSAISKTEKECHISHSHFDGTVWDLIPGIKDSMFPHQREAFEFMWKNLAGTIQIDELKKHVESDETGGCVISHAPGTGKTRLSIMFLKSYMNIFPDCRPVIVAPPGLLPTWKNEFKKWRVDMDIYDLNDDRRPAFQEYAMEQATLLAARDTRAIRLGKLLSWSKHKSVILVSYNLLAHKVSEFSSFLLEKAGLIIFDEGHTPRNDRSIVWMKLKNIKTSKRIILSGTPFQNNFQELYNTLQLVRPKFADKLSSKTSKRPYNMSYNTKQAEKEKKKGKFVEKDDAKSKWVILTKNVNASDNDLKLSIDEVKSVIAPFVHVHNGEVLDTLPGLRKCMLILNPLPLQNIVRKKMNEMKHQCAFGEDYRYTLVNIHPSLVTASLSEEEKLMLDTEMLENVRLHPNEGAKTNFVIELTRLCEALNEKIIVFCQYLEPLDLIKDQLIKIFDWSEGKEILKFVGGLQSMSRQTLIDDFNNDSSNARVLLASTKACSEGISLVGASRVVLLDILWNPSIEVQAICRAHRIGQKKFVYVYQLITFGMKENEKFGVQANKKKISNLVFPPTLDGNSLEASSNLEELDTTKLIAEDKVLVEMTGHVKFKDVFQKICFLSKETSCTFGFNLHKI